MNASHAGPAFATTEWSVILGARERHTTEGRAALERLCRAYWPPVYGYLRRRGHAPADAEDLTQGFFLELLEGDFLDRPDPAKGRFRGYLIGALKHFLSGHYERAGALKRGAGARVVAWDEAAAEREIAALGQPGGDPSDLFERSWAYTLLGRALRRLGEEQAAAGRTRQFEVLKAFLSTTPSRGDYELAAVQLATTRPTVAVWVHRLNQRYAELVKLEVAATVGHPADVGEEMQHLLQTLRR